MSHMDVWAPRDAVEQALAPLLTGDPTTNTMGSTVAQAGDAVLIVGTSIEGHTLVVVEANDGNPEAESRRVYEDLENHTDWRLRLWDEDGSHVLAERPQLVTA